VQHMSKIIDKRKLAKDRRCAAVHEAGHMIVGHYYRIPMSGWIGRNYAPPATRTREYIGEAQSEKPIEDRNIDRQICVAGDIAVLAWYNSPRPDVSDFII